MILFFVILYLIGSEVSL